MYLQRTFDQPSIERAQEAPARTAIARLAIDRTAMNRPSELDQLLDQAP